MASNFKRPKLEIPATSDHESYDVESPLASTSMETRTSPLVSDSESSHGEQSKKLEIPATSDHDSSHVESPLASTSMETRTSPLVSDSESSHGEQSKMDYFPLDQLPMLCIEAIAKELSNQDVAALCAVSRGVRMAFDIKEVWKPRVDEERAKYLLSTPCKVQPVFEHPESPNSSLSSVSEYRLSFMAENHLWNNWRQGNFKRKLLRIKVDKVSEGFAGKRRLETPLNCLFLTNDLVVAVFEHKMEILNVRYTSVSRRYKPIFIEYKRYSTKILTANGMILVVYGHAVLVFSLINSSKEWILKHGFFCEDSDTLKGDDTIRIVQSKILKLRICDKFTTVGNVFVCAKRGDLQIHIWNFETGVKIKEEKCPVENAFIDNIFVSASKDIILSMERLPRENNFVLLAYSLAKQMFLPFREIVKGSIIQMVENYIAVWYGKHLHFYDYLNFKIMTKNHLVFETEVEPRPRSSIFCEPQVFGDSIVFLEKDNFKFYNPSTNLVKTVSNEVLDIHYYMVLSSRFIAVSKRFLTGPWHYEILEVQKPFKVCKITTCTSLFQNIWSPHGFKINKCNSRALVPREKEIIHFW